MTTIIVWFRNDLRLHDHPALSAAIADADNVIPLFILDDKILHGKHAGSNRNRFLLECLQDLAQNLRAKQGNLIIRSGSASDVLPALIAETGAQAVYATEDFSPYAVARDKRVKSQLEKTRVTLRLFTGRLAVTELDAIRTQSGAPYKVFTPFWKNWQGVERRAVYDSPEMITVPKGIQSSALPNIADITEADDLSAKAMPGGETAARKQLETFLSGPLQQYHTTHNDMAADATSHLSPYLHFGCLSPREIETMLPEGAGAAAWHRQLAWREFYHYVLRHFPSNTTREFQERYHTMQWDNNTALLRAWQQGKTGCPIVDAAMRQLQQEGWMHNRARLIVGSFLTKDLWQDWRLGEQYFMKMLVDGDEANNNGNWQWIASVGVDPAPVFRRLYNPASQQATYDPKGEYVRKYVPELSQVPDAYLAEPWKMPEAIQSASGCRIGTDYPSPVVDHAEARKAALDRYKKL